jgi:hypothetical protein
MASFMPADPAFESIYNLIPKPPVVITKEKRYKSHHDPKAKVTT